jgi:hypothetical protein
METGGDGVKESRDGICIRDMLCLLGVGLLSPMIWVLPRWSAAVAGEAGWMAPLAAMVPLLAEMACLYWAVNRLPEGEGLGELMLRAFGSGFGRLVCAVYFLWMLFNLCVALRLYGERFMSTAYRDTSLSLFLVVLLAIELWISHGTLGAFARMGRIFTYILVTTMTLVMAFSLPNMDARNLLPIWFDDAPAVASSSLLALANMGVGIFLFFLSGKVIRRKENRRVAMSWAAGFCVLMALLSAVIIGCFGARLVTRMQVPFFTLTKEIKITGAIDRVESLVVAVWVLTDVVLIGLLLRVACAAGRIAFRLESGQRLATPILFAAFPGAYLVAENMFALTELSNGILTVGNLILAYGVPFVACLTAKLRKRI